MIRRGPGPAAPLLSNGDRYTRAEFERRYEELAARGDKRKFELVDGVVYMPSPVSESHGAYALLVGAWLTNYSCETAGTRTGSNATLRLDEDNVVQPDIHLRRLPEAGGRAVVDPDDYLRGPIELAAEVALSSAAYDLHQKKAVYRRHGVREYLVVVADVEVHWFRLEASDYHTLAPDPAGVIRSLEFPGLWLDTKALLERDGAKVMRTLAAGLAAR